MRIVRNIDGNFMTSKKESGSIIFRAKEWDFAPVFFAALEKLNSEGVKISKSKFARLCVEFGLDGAIETVRAEKRDREKRAKHLERIRTTCSRYDCEFAVA
jgi:hypothetical protein